MFTIKHYNRRGQAQVRSCDSYSYDPADPSRMVLSMRGGERVVINIAPDEEVFIENMHGRTVTAIRNRGKSDVQADH